MTASVNLAPPPKLRFVDANGNALVGGLVFTYAAGTTTKQATYTDSTGSTANTNPVVLDARGEASIWFDQTLAYKVVLSPAGDTDPPTAPIWTQDNLPSSQTVGFANTLAASTGAGLSGFSHANTYAAGTVGLALQGYVNVKNAPYNARGDGSADDTAAFVAALATGKDVFVPFGTYKLTSSLTMSTSQQQIQGAGRLAQMQFAMASSSPAIIFTGSNGRQRVTGLTITASNCPKLFSFQSPQVQIFFNWLTNSTSGGIVNYLENEGGGVYSFGTFIAYNFIHGSFTTGSRGVRLGLNSQTSQIIGNTIDNFESAISVENATDTLVIEGNVLETLMPTGYAVDMRGVGGSPTYKSVSIRRNHIEDAYGAVAWGNNALGPTYTSCSIADNYFNGHSGGTNYFLSIVGLCGAGSANNRVEFNDASNSSGVSTVTAFFNLADQNGAVSLMATKGNTVGSGAAFATGTYANYAYTIREQSGYFGAALVSGTFTSQSSTRQEVANTTFRIPLRWDEHEYLESVQFKYASSGATPSVTMNLRQVNADTDTVLLTTGSVTANGVVTMNVNTTAVPNFLYYLEFVCALNGGTTAYVYPAQAFIRQ